MSVRWPLTCVRVGIDPAGRRRRDQPEKRAQADIQDFLLSIGGAVYILGTRRRAGSPCPNCGMFVAEHQGTRQTKGLCDVLAFLPTRPGARARRLLLMVEVKVGKNKRTPEQDLFRALCGEADLVHLTGDLDTVLRWATAEGYVRGPRQPDMGRGWRVDR